MKLHVFPASPNSRKAMMVNALLGLDIPAAIVDLQAGEQKAPAFLALNPNGKLPVLEFDDGTTLWESNALIDHMAALAESDLWPKTNARYDIMRWQFWEGCHWTPACSKFISKHFFNDDSIDLDAAETDVRRFAAVLDGHLAGRDWLVGEAMTTADISVAAILCYRAPCQYPLAGFPNIARWIGRIEALDAWQAANPVLEAA